MFVVFFWGGVLFSVSGPWGFFLLFFFGGGVFFVVVSWVPWFGWGGSGTPWLVTSALQGYFQIILVVNGR